MDLIKNMRKILDDIEKKNAKELMAFEDDIYINPIKLVEEDKDIKYSDFISQLIKANNDLVLLRFDDTELLQKLYQNLKDEVGQLKIKMKGDQLKINTCYWWQTNLTYQYLGNIGGANKWKKIRKVSWKINGRYGKGCGPIDTKIEDDKEYTVNDIITDVIAEYK